MAPVFSIRHYLIDRVAGLIVRGGLFQGCLCVGQWQPSPPLLHPQLYEALSIVHSPRRGPPTERLRLDVPFHKQLFDVVCDLRALSEGAKCTRPASVT